ncbi:MAG: response regulator, partial [Armatimonadetes bacterium]|nr:response regulator [Armatimonadota bacterium]
RRDELSRVCRSINGMLGSLECAQRQREQSERRRAAIVEHAHEGICLLDPETGLIEEANPALHTILRQPPGLLRGLPLGALLGQDEREWRDRLRQPGRDHRWDTVLRHADGAETDLEIALSLLNEDDRTVACVAVRDVTERRQAQRDRERLERELYQVQKLQAVGELAAGLAHNFNNVLATITSAIELVVMDGNEKVNHRLELALSSAAKAAGMVKQFLLFSRQMPIERRPVKLQHVVEEVAEMCRRTFDRKIKVRTRVGDLPCVVGDQSQIHGILLSMCINARDALDLDTVSCWPPCIELRAEAVQAHPEGLPHPQMAPGRYVRLTVSDNGRGMDADTRQRCFEPFFTTKEVGKGTGLGLSTAYGVVTEHGGFITCESQSGAGTTFDIYLPVADLPARPASLPTSLRSLAGHGEVVLLIEDENELRGMIGDLVEGNGYRVLRAADGREGMALFSTHLDEIDVVVLDLSMPRMSGWEAMKAMHGLRPDVDIILTSGYPVDAADLGPARVALQKPFECSRLLRTIRQVLEAPHAAAAA